MLRFALPLALAALLSAPAAAQQAAPVQFRAALSGSNQVPPNQATGTGTATATLDPTTKVLTYKVEHSGLTGPATGAHFHGPAEPNSNAGVVVPFPSPASPISGTATLTETQAAHMMAGLWYANVHTAANPGGEIRGQMLRTP